jgi:acetylornithine/N-succinyldiaminopimelate aminotransferase
VNQRQIFLNNIAQTSPFPLELEVTNAKGIYITDASGKKYIDFISGIGVSAIGHCQPSVVQAIQRQSAAYMHTMVYGEHIQSPQTQLAHFLKSILPPSLDNIFYVNSGAEAVEGALKLAKKYTKRHEVIAFKNAYHGSTAGAAALMSDPIYTSVSGPHVSGVKFIEYNNVDHLKKITSSTAAVICEIIKAEAGIIIGENQYLQQLRNRCNATGTLLIVDEIQTGCGRTGTWFAFQQADIIPDILLLGKAFGGGLPLAAFIAPKSIMQTLSDKPILSHITTFGGNPVCCAASLATLTYISENNLIDEVYEKSQIMVDILSDYTIRNAGLMAAIQLNSFNDVMKVCQGCMNNGVLIDWFLFNNTSIRLAPPLTISTTEMLNAATIIRDEIKKL